MGESPEIDFDTVRLLIEKAREGDDAAQSDLAEHVQNYISIMADQKLEKSIRTNVGPSDIVQQTLIQMVKGIDNYRGQSTAEFYGWLNQIVKNEAKRASRDLKRQKRDIRRQTSMDGQDSVVRRMNTPQDAHPTPGTEAISKERIELFYRALEQLPEDYATVIRLRNLDELSFDEIGEKMGRSSGAVSKLWFRAIVKFQAELDKLDEQTRH